MGTMLALPSLPTLPEVPWASWVVILGVSLVAGVTDARSRRIPNVLTLPTLAVGLIVALSLGGVADLAGALIAAVLLSVPYVLLFLFAGGGAGDAKLMAAVGAWLGVVNGLLVLLVVSLCGVVLALGYALRLKRRRAALDASEVGCTEAGSVGAMTVPYGVAIFAGVWITAAGVALWL